MKNLNKLSLLVASAALAMSANYANAAHGGSVNNWVGTDGTVWRTGDNSLCWQDSAWTAGTAAGVDCGAAAPAVMQNPGPVTPPSQGPENQKISYAADALFDFDKATLKPAGKQALDELVRRMSAMKAIDTVIATGHTDSIGPDAYNQKLSVRRAEAVKAYLVERGVPSNLIFVEGKGEADPIASNATRQGRAENRRVVIEVVGLINK